VIFGENGSLPSDRSICGVRLGGEELGDCWLGESYSTWNRVDFLHFCCPEGPCAPLHVTGDNNCDLLSSPERSDNWSSVKCLGEPTEVEVFRCL
jgi:hypothetical protein